MQHWTLTRILTSRLFIQRALLPASLLFLLLAAPTAAAPSGQGPQPSARYAAGEILVRFKSQVTDPQRAAILTKHNAQISRNIASIRVARLKVPSQSVQQTLAAMKGLPELEFAELNYIATKQDTPTNDPDFSKQWGLQAIAAPTAWDVQKGASAIVVGLVDTGVDLGHPDLKNKIVTGWNVITGANNPQDDNGHGTHVAGIIAAETNNGTGIAGVSWGAKIMPIKALDSSGSGTYSDIAEGVIYAADHGAKIINMSLGGSAPSVTLEDAINYASGKGVVIVAAAGNQGAAGVTYPAKYTNTIAVAAVDSNLSLASFSSQGPEVDIAAPGVNIYSTFSAGSYKSMSGTSMATPHVSGVAALLMSSSQFDTPAKVRSAIETNALDLGSAGKDTSFGSGLLKANAALGYSDATPLPPTPTRTATPGISASLTRTFTPSATPTSVTRTVAPVSTSTMTPTLGSPRTPTKASSPVPKSTQPSTRITVDFGRFVTDTDLQNAINNTILVKPATLLEGSKFSATSAYQTGEWFLISIASLNGPDSSLEHVGAGKSSGLLIAHKDSLKRWHVALSGTSEFSRVLQSVPETLVSARSRPVLDPLAQPPTVKSVEYRFPWIQNWKYWNGFSHSNPPALDIGSPGADMSVLTAGSGTVTNICSGTLTHNISIRDSDGVTMQYFHIRKDTLNAWVREGVAVPRGTVLGMLRYGYFDYDGCGYADQNPDSAHLHWVVPTDRAFTVDGWTITYPNNNWVRDGEIRSPGQTILSTNQANRYQNDIGGLVKKRDGSVIAGAAVTFSGGGITLSTKTDDNGIYTFIALPPGNGTISASAEGYFEETKVVTIVDNLCMVGPEFVLDPFGSTCASGANTSGCVTPTRTATAQPGVIDGFQLVSVSSPTVMKGQAFSVNIAYKIVSGSLLQSRGDHLHATPEDNSNAFGAWPVQAVSGSHYAGETYTFSFNLTAPNQTGNFASHWRLRVGGNHVGPEALINFTVQDQPPAPPGGVYLCQGTNYGVPCYGPYLQDYSYVGDEMNDKTQSVYISGCYRAVLYWDSNFGGEHLYTTGSTDLGSHWRIQASSIRVISCDNAAFKIYELGDYNGEEWRSDRTIYDLGHWGHNDWAQSIRIESGKGIVACEHADFHGICGRSTGPREISDINALAQGLRNGLSSVRVCSGECPQPPGAPSLLYPVDNGYTPSNQDVIVRWSGDGLQYQAELSGGGISGTRTFGWVAASQWNVGSLPESVNAYHWRVRGWSYSGEGGWTEGAFYVRAPTIHMNGVFTTDENGTAAATGKMAQPEKTQVSTSAYKSSFNAGDPIRLYLDLTNDFALDTPATLEWLVLDPGGRVVPDLYLGGVGSVPSGRVWWHYPAVIPTDAVTGDYTFVGSVDYNGQITSKSTVIHVSGLSSVVALGVFTTDQDGTASAATKRPQTRSSKVMASSIKTSFNSGDPIQLYIDTYNSTSANADANIEWRVVDPVGRLVGGLSYSGTLTSPAGRSWWYLSSSIPANALTGDYSFTGSITYNGQSTTQTASFHVNGAALVQALGVFTTDHVGISASPQGGFSTQKGGAKTSSLKTIFDAGESMRLYIDSFNNLSQDATATFTYEVISPIGNTVSEMSALGDATIPPGWWGVWIGRTIPSDALTGDYLFRGYVTYDGQTTGYQTSFHVNAPASLPVLSVFATDQNGTASAANRTPQLRKTRVSTSSVKTTFNAGDPIQLYIDTYNNGTQDAVASFEWRVTDSLGRPVPELSWSGDLTTPPGWVWWFLSSTIPANARTGNYTFVGSITYSGQPSSQSMNFTVAVTNAGVPLLSDWNLVSLPITPTVGYTAASLLAGINGQSGDCSEVDRWYNGGWDTHVGGLPFNDFPITLNTGYFLRCTRSSTLSLQGVSVNQAIPVTLYPDWNIAAVPFAPTSLAAEGMLNEITNQGGNCTEVDRWVNGGWDSHLRGLPFNNFTIDPGKGHFVLCSTPSSYSPGGGALSARFVPPKLPSLDSLRDLSKKPSITKIEVSNVRSNSFSVSWVTNKPAHGWVNFGTTSSLGNVAYDDRGGPIVDDTHHVTVANLQPNTTYYFALVSDGTVDDKSNARYRATTGPSLTVPVPDVIYGRVLKRDGKTPVEGAIVYLTVSDKDGRGSTGSSGVLSAIVDRNGYWQANLGNLRTDSLSQFFIYSASGDTLMIRVEGAEDGGIKQTLDTSSHAPVAPLILR